MQPVDVKLWLRKEEQWENGACPLLFQSLHGLDAVNEVKVNWLDS